MSTNPLFVTQAYPVNPGAPPERTFSNDATTSSITAYQATTTADDESHPTDIVKFLAQLQAINPTRSALLAQVQQLVYQIEHDKRLYPGDKTLLLNDSMRTTIRKLEEDYNNRGFNRPNCPIRRDLMFHYANLYIKYNEVLLEKKSPTPLNAPVIGSEPAVATAVEEDIRRRRPATAQVASTTRAAATTANRANTFDTRVMEGERQRKKEKFEIGLHGLILLIVCAVATYCFFLVVRWIFRFFLRLVWSS